MRCNSFLRAGTAGAIGVGLFFCLGMRATSTAHADSRIDNLELTSTPVTPEPSSNTSTPDGSAVGDDQPASAKTFSPQITPWRRVTVESGDSLSQVFVRVGMHARDWIELLDVGDKVEPLRHLRPGNTLEIRKTPTGHLSELHFKLNAVDTLVVTRQSGNLKANVIHVKSQNRRLTASGRVDGSLWQSLRRVGVPASVATQLSHIYKYRADLSRRMHPGDRFSVIYDAEFANGKRLTSGPIIAASITTGGRSLKTFRAVAADGKAGYYDASGHSYKPSISRHPVNYRRISSPFDRNRMHPILHIRRPHNGVDMAAARGTPIHAAANGVVKFAGRKRGYGRLVELRHFNGYTTRYGHMYKFVSGLHTGEHVTQGEVIGYVGATGVATGPHLHYEIRKDGIPHNPLTMHLPDGQPLPAGRLATFTNRIQPLIARLDHVPGMPKTLIASNAGNVSPDSRCVRAGAVNAALALAPAGASKNNALADLFCVVPSDGKA